MNLPWFLTNPKPEVFLEDDYVVFDFETTNHDRGNSREGKNRIVLVTWMAVRPGEGRPRTRVARYGERAFQQFVEDFERAPFVVAHNAKFESGWCQRIGLDVSNRIFYCTMVGEYVRLGNRRSPLDLDSVLRRFGIEGKSTLVKRLIAGGVCPSEIPARWLEEYGKQDTSQTAELFRVQRDELSKLGLLPVQFTRCLAIPVLADIERNGVCVDDSRVTVELSATRTKRAEIEQELHNLAGGINLRSGKQLGEYLYGKLGLQELRLRDGSPDRTDSGKPRTDADTIARLTADGASPEAVRFLELFKEYPALLKAEDTLKKLKLTADEDDGILYFDFNQTIVQTHRLSSSGRKRKIQGQNIDRDFKRLFKARHPGWKIGEADGAQLEFRVAAHLGRDSVALSDILADFDIHRLTASELFRVPLESVTKDQRQEAKPWTFRPLYGGDAGPPHVKRYFKAFRERYKGIYETQDSWCWEVLKNKKLRTESGLIFYWPDCKMEGKYIKYRTNIFNYPVQSLATAEIIPIALVYFWHRIKASGLKMFLVNTIHDSVIAEVPPEESEKFHELAKISFTKDVYIYLQKVYNIHFTVPLGTESKLGDFWSEGEGQKYNLIPEE